MSAERYDLNYMNGHADMMLPVATVPQDGLGLIVPCLLAEFYPELDFSGFKVLKAPLEKVWYNLESSHWRFSTVI